MESASSTGSAGEMPPEIIVYPIRRRTFLWVLMCASGAALYALGCLVVPIVVLVVPQAHGSAVILLELLLAEILLIAGGIALYLCTRLMLNVMRSGAPTLVVSSHGIRVGKLFGTSDIILPWHETAAIFLNTRTGYRLFCIRPTRPWRFLGRFGPYTRLCLLGNLLYGAPLVVSQSFLDQPIEDILQKVQNDFGETMSLNGVQILPARTRFS